MLLVLPPSPQPQTFEGFFHLFLSMNSPDTHVARTIKPHPFANKLKGAGAKLRVTHLVEYPLEATHAFVARVLEPNAARAQTKGRQTTPDNARQRRLGPPAQMHIAGTETHHRRCWGKGVCWRVRLGSVWFNVTEDVLSQRFGGMGSSALPPGKVAPASSSSWWSLSN